MKVDSFIVSEPRFNASFCSTVEAKYDSLLTCILISGPCITKLAKYAYKDGIQLHVSNYELAREL
jgi:hypothetical protein